MSKRLRDTEFEREASSSSKEFARRVIPKYDAACDRALNVLIVEAYRSGFKHGMRTGYRRGLEVGKREGATHAAAAAQEQTR